VNDFSTTCIKICELIFLAESLIEFSPRHRLG